MVCWMPGLTDNRSWQMHFFAILWKPIQWINIFFFTKLLKHYSWNDNFSELLQRCFLLSFLCCNKLNYYVFFKRPVNSTWGRAGFSRGLACLNVALSLLLLWMSSFCCIAALMSKGPCISGRRPDRTCLLKKSCAGAGPSLLGANLHSAKAVQKHSLLALHLAMMDFIWPTRRSQRPLLGLL